jgi:hypothetical protein
MTWSKIHTSTVTVDTAAASFADAKHYEQWAEIFSWLTGRGWTVTERTGNASSNEYNYWRLEKEVTTYEGTQESYLWNFRLQNLLSSGTGEWFNGRVTDIDGVTPGTSGIDSHSGYLPAGIADGIEFWQSDQDNDSFLIITRFASGVCRSVGLHPGEGSFRSTGLTTTASYASRFSAIYPVWGANQMRIQGANREMGFGEIVHDYTYRNQAVPVITHGEVTIHDEEVAHVKWRQADVSTLENPSHARREWNPVSSTHYNTRVIDGTYYIALGDVGGNAVALLDCGAVNPNINI